MIGIIERPLYWLGTQFENGMFYTFLINSSVAMENSTKYGHVIYKIAGNTALSTNMVIIS